MTSGTSIRSLIDVETTSCVYWEGKQRDNLQEQPTLLEIDSNTGVSE